MTRMPEPRELDPVAAGLIRASLTGDKSATDRILTRAVEADLEAQAVALIDNLINGLVREHARTAA
jgi:hypothetical protein